ncbi:hypothetical protein LOK49_LG06G00611 [Camellia lanceoleosa]|uniref:Uncharacterized protein n=1 Tax=Camellia lanceoleosa TaxID=1840588 RepID=A0ACC0HBM1_9ERIC|nr:hypothetical protein LOK49_LG06G00611 [Camellia lanceoleosa]
MINAILQSRRSNAVDCWLLRLVSSGGCPALALRPWLVSASDVAQACRFLPGLVSSSPASSTLLKEYILQL